MEAVKRTSLTQQPVYHPSNKKNSNVNDKNSSTVAATSQASTGTVMFKRAAAPITENDILNLDLNTVDDVSTLFSCLERVLAIC
jgi:hypothetical protein